MMNFIREQDEFLGELRTKATMKILPFVVNGMVAIGIIGEMMAIMFKDKGVRSLIENNRLGYLGYYFRHKERRDIKAKIKETATKLVEDKVDPDEWVKRFMPFK